jgi:predicted transcriptional regulator
MDQEALMMLTAEIVSAHVGNNSVAAGDVGNLICSVHGALVQAAEPAAAPEPDLVPAVSIRASVKNDAITCLECGRKMKMLKRHLTTDHAMTPAEYRARWKLSGDYPLVAPDYAKRRADLAKTIGLGRKRRVAAPPPAPAAAKRARGRPKAAAAQPAAAQPATAQPAAADQSATPKVAASAKIRKPRKKAVAKEPAAAAAKAGSSDA